MISYEQLIKVLKKAHELNLIDKFSHGNNDGEFDRDITFTTVRDDKNYKISWWKNISYLHISDSIQLPFHGLELSGTWPNHFKTNFQFRYHGETCLIMGLEK